MTTVSEPALYFDDPPVDPGSDSRGLGPVNSRMIELFKPSAVFINRMRLRPGQMLFQPPGPRYQIVLGSLDGTAIRAAGRFSRLLTTGIETVALRAVRWPHDLPERYLFAPVGSDLGSIHRALEVARGIGAELLLYLVDDPLAATRATPGGAASAAWFSTMLRQCHTVFCITQPLCDLLHRHHDIVAQHLPLPYIYDDAIRPRQHKNQIIYVGSVNEIYRRELEYWIGLLDDVGFFREGRLLVTGDIGERPGVVRTTFASRALLEQEIADSRAALLPVSSQESDLCYSSFPSKTLDYLAYSNLILSSAPEGSVISDFFDRFGLPHCFPEGRVRPDDLMSILNGKATHLSAYRHVLDTAFSPAAFARTIRAAVEDPYASS